MTHAQTADRNDSQNRGRSPGRQWCGRGGRRSGTGAPPRMRGWGTVTIVFLGGSLAPLGVTVSFLSTAAAENSIG